MRLRVGTRGSHLALTQTRLVCDELRMRYPDLDVEEVIIATYGDRHPDHAVTDASWPAGGFVSAIEQALIDREIDFAVHSCKDLPAIDTPGLAVAAVPVREVAHDVLLTGSPVELDRVPAGLRIGTSSPRRAAQIRRVASVEVVPLRGNVPSRVARLEHDLDGVILAAAGLRRLGIRHPHTLDLPLGRFVPAPAQGALAVQVREDDEQVRGIIAELDHAESRIAVAAERAVLAQLGGGCSVPLGVHGAVRDDRLELRGQMFDAGGHVVEARGTSRAQEPCELAGKVAEQLRRQIRNAQAGGDHDRQRDSHLDDA